MGDKDAIIDIRELFSYERKFMRYDPQAHRNVLKVYRASLLKSQGGLFFTGLVPRAVDFLRSKKYEVKVIDQSEKIKATNLPTIKIPADKKKNWDVQLPAIKTFLKTGRGVILAPTGIGKTVIASAVISCYKNKRTLFLVHTKTLVRQTAKEFMRFLDLKDICLIGEGQKKISGNIVVGTIQTFSKLDPEIYIDYFDIVIVDEVHHFSSDYEKTVASIMAPVRLGLTATMPKENPQRMLTIEGLIGPVDSEITVQDGVESALLAKPKIKLLKTNYRSDIRELRKYPDVYNAGIVENKERNQQIAQVTQTYLKLKLTVLIIVTNIEHGKNIQKELNRLKLDAPFIQGSTKSDEREELRNRFDKKLDKVVIASVVWKEGVNIPSLGVIINAAGGKSEIPTLQAVGRGLRRTKDKDEIIVVDFFDPSHPMLISHFGHRITTYMTQNWM